MDKPNEAQQKAKLMEKKFRHLQFSSKASSTA